MLQKSGRLVLWEAMFILELHSAETQELSIKIICCLQLFELLFLYFATTAILD